MSHVLKRYSGIPASDIFQDLFAASELSKSALVDNLRYSLILVDRSEDTFVQSWDCECFELTDAHL